MAFGRGVTLASLLVACLFWSGGAFLRSGLASRRPRVQRGRVEMAFDPTLATKEIARAQFFLWFFGGSGAAGIGVGQVPKLYGRDQDVQALKGVGKSLGGETLGISSTLLGYPEDICIKDIRQVLDNTKKVSVAQMIAKGPKETYLATKGYLTLPAFEAANKGANPLATRVVFDIFVGAGAAPDQAQTLFDTLREDPSEDLKLFKGALIKAKVQSNSALIVLAFILTFAGKVCYESALVAFF